MKQGCVALCESIPRIRAEIRYATAHNLTGHPLDGYLTGRAIATVEAAHALAKAWDVAHRLGYGMLIYDAYRPQKAVNDFVCWSSQAEDNLTKAEFYPTLDKTQLFPLGYIALRSGHSRGSTIDLTLTVQDMPINMGTTFDFMNDSSHHGAPGLTPEQQKNRSILCGIMAYAGFAPYENEWWHYRLMSEPYPDTYFDFDIA